MIEELKLFAVALKMNTAFSTVDKRSKEWIDEGWSTKTLEDLKKEAAESEGAQSYNELKNKYLDMKDDFEKAVKDLRGKLQRFEQDPYSHGASPILRYERNVDQYGVKGKVFLGFNSHQAKGYRIIELEHPRWLEQLMQKDPDVFYSQKLSEGDVYALVPSKGIDQEKLSVLNNDYFEDLEKAGVPAFDTFRGYKELKPEFISRFNKTIDQRLPFDTNVLRLQALVEAIKREHTLAVPATRAVATGPPALIPVLKIVEAPKRPLPKYAKNQDVTYKGAEYTILDLSFQNGVWLYELNAPGVSLFKPENEIQPAPEQLLSVYTVPGVRFVEGFEDQGAAFRKADEMRKQFPGSVYRVVKPEGLQHKWRPFEVWLVNRGYEVPEKIRVAEPIKTVSTPLYTTADVTPPAAKFKKGNKVAMGTEVWIVKTPEFDKVLKKWAYVLETPPGLYRRPYEAELTLWNGIPETATSQEEDLVAAPSEEEVKEEAKLEKEAEEDRELQEEPEQIVYVKVIVEGGVPANDKGEMKIETPQFTLTATTYEELAKYGNEWGNDAMWSRPIVGMFGVKQLLEVLKDGEIEYDAIEDMGLTWGNDWDAIRESLSENPPPFNKYALFHIKWRPEDLMFTQAAADTHDVYMTRYTKDELLHESKHQLQVIAKVKDLGTGGEIGELIDRIVAFNPEAAGEPEEFPNLVEQQPKEDIEKLIEKREIEIGWTPEVAKELENEDEEIKKALAGRLSTVKDVEGWYPFREFSASVMVPGYNQGEISSGDYVINELKKRGYNSRITLGGKSNTMGWLMVRIYTDKQVPMPTTEYLKDLLYTNVINGTEGLHASVQEAYRRGGMKAAVDALKQSTASGSVGYGPIEIVENMDYSCKAGEGCTLELKNNFSQWSGREIKVRLSWNDIVNYAVNTPLSDKEHANLIPAAAAPQPKPSPAVTQEEINLTLGEIQRETEEGTSAGGAFRDNITFHTHIGREDGAKFDVIIKRLLESGQIIERSPGSGVYLYKGPAQPKQPTQVTKPKSVTSPAAPAPTYKPTKILSSEDMRLLQDYWNTQFIRAIGKVPAGFSSVFRIEFQEVKTLPFAEAKAAILAAADREISGIEQSQRARAVIRQGEKFRPEPLKPTAPGRKERTPEEEEEEGFKMPLGIKAPPSAFPLAPLSIMQPFPRGPTSLEQMRLWKVFCFDMQQESYDCNTYSREFAEYISKSQFLSWEDLKQRFEFFEETIMEGATLPPLVQWRSKLTTPTGLKGELKELEPSPEPAKLTTQQIEDEEKNAVKRQRILISHWASVLIHQARYYNKVKTMSDLYDEVVARGVIDASIPEEIFIPIAKEAIREISSQKLRPVELMKTDGEEEEVEKLNLAKVPWVDISQREVEDFLGTG